MGSSNKRAKDIDRDLAVDFVEAAWADGQLTREEYDARVDRLLRAKTLTELEREVRDLQGEGGARWRPGSHETPVAARTVPATQVSRPVITRPATQASARAVAVGIGAVVSFAVVLALFPFATSNQEMEATPVQSGEASVAPQGLSSDSPLTAIGYDTMVAQMPDIGGSTVFEALLTAHGAVLISPQDAVSDAGWRREWDGSTFSDPVSTEWQASRLNLEMVDAQSIETAVADFVDRTGAAPEEVVVRLRVAATDAGRVCVRAEAPGVVPDTVLSYDCHGREVS